MSKKIILFGTQNDLSWAFALRESLNATGRFEVTLEYEALNHCLQRQFDLAVIDAGTIKVEEVVQLITKIRTQMQSIPIIVATASPTWQRARHFFLAGATDYIRKTLDESKNATTFDEIFSRSMSTPKKEKNIGI